MIYILIPAEIHLWSKCFHQMVHRKTSILRLKGHSHVDVFLVLVQCSLTVEKCTENHTHIRLKKATVNVVLYQKGIYFEVKLQCE